MAQARQPHLKPASPPRATRNQLVPSTHHAVLLLGVGRAAGGAKGVAAGGSGGVVEGEATRRSADEATRSGACQVGAGGDDACSRGAAPLSQHLPGSRGAGRGGEVSGRSCGAAEGGRWVQSWIPCCPQAARKAALAQARRHAKAKGQECRSRQPAKLGKAGQPAHLVAHQLLVPAGELGVVPVLACGRKRGAGRAGRHEHGAGQRSCHARLEDLDGMP